MYGDFQKPAFPWNSHHFWQSRLLRGGWRHRQCERGNAVRDTDWASAGWSPGSAGPENPDISKKSGGPGCCQVPLMWDQSENKLFYSLSKWWLNCRLTKRTQTDSFHQLCWDTISFARLPPFSSVYSQKAVLWLVLPCSGCAGAGTEGQIQGIIISIKSCFLAFYPHRKRNILHEMPSALGITLHEIC